MTKLKYLISLFALTAVSLYSAEIKCCDEMGYSGFMPDNDLYIPAINSGLKDSGMSPAEEKFHTAIDRVTKVYSPLIEEMGNELKVIKSWEDGTVNAYARPVGKQMEVHIMGGLARHPEMTDDALTMVVCHELGHHLGGAPKKLSWWGTTTWASNEGQADYFAAAKCMRKLLGESWRAKSRIVSAGLALAKTLGSLGKVKQEVSYSKRDESKVTRTYDGHPKAQCRLDTYISGAYCPEDSEVDFDKYDPNVGACLHTDKGWLERFGARPLCWYKPT